MVRRKNARRGRGGRGRRSQVHTLSYTCSFSVDKREGTRNLLHEAFSIDTSRCCRVKLISMRYNSAHNMGTTFSFTIESSTSTDDAVTRSPPLLLSTFPQRYTLRCPRSTDFAYITNKSSVSDLTLYNSAGATSENVYSFFLVTVVMEFKPMQPNYKDLGLLPPRSPFIGDDEDDRGSSSLSII